MKKRKLNLVLSECEGDKALGPDGFSFSVIRAVWDVLKLNFLDMLLEFHSKGE